MLDSIRRLVEPSFEDEDLNRRAYALNVIALSGLVLVTGINGSLLVRDLVRASGNFALNAGLLIGGIVWFALAYWLSRRGYVNAASHVFLWGGVALVLVGHMADPGEGPSDPLWDLFSLLVVGGSLLLGTRWSLTFATLGTVLYLVAPLVKVTYDPDAVQVSFYEGMLMVSTMFSVAAFVWLFRSGLEKALRKSRNQAEELERTQRILEERFAVEQRQRQHLEETVQTYGDYMAQVGQGNLSARLPLNGHTQQANDPLTALGHRLNETVGSLQQTIQRIYDAASELGSAATEILAAATQQASGATEQSAAISQTTTTVDEIRTIAEQLVSRSQDVVGGAAHTIEVSQTGREQVQQTVASMGQIKTRVDLIEENIIALSERTQQIGEIIDAVNAIASQSNMLALNAAVEAARAGEQGKGFAVVAQEVRDLAERSRQATAQVQSILSDIQRATASTAMATEEGKKEVDAGVQRVTLMGKTIDQLAQVLDESAQSAAQMAAGGQQQSSGVAQIAMAMQNINQATAQSLASTRQTESSAQTLNQLARELREIVEQYQL